MMLVALTFVREMISRLRIGTDISEELQELEALKAEAEEVLRNDRSWVRGSMLARLFFDEIEEARNHLQNGNRSRVNEHRSSAKATLQCIKLNIRHSTEPAGQCVAN